MKPTQNLLKLFQITLIIFAISTSILSCKKDDPTPSPKAEFTFDIQNNGFVKFHNQSVNFTKSSWNYGDEESDNVLDYDTDHVHRFTKNGTYQITLKVSNKNLQDVIVKSVYISSVK